MLYRFKKWTPTGAGAAALRPLRWFSKNHGDEVIEAFQKGDETAFSQLYSRYKKPIMKYISEMVRDPDTAHDLSQEVFLKVFRFRASYQARYAFSTWLWTIARHTVFDWTRRKNTELAPADEQPFAVEQEVPCPEPLAEAILDRKTEKQLLARLLRQLTVLQRRVVLLRMVHHLSYDEIAKKLGMSLSAVKCLAYRSKRALAEMGYSPALV